MFLDETIQKGWGLGSGISLFIMAGVAQQILCALCVGLLLSVLVWPCVLGGGLCVAFVCCFGVLLCVLLRVEQ